MTAPKMNEAAPDIEGRRPGHCKHCGNTIAVNPLWQKGDGSPMYTHVKVLPMYCREGE